MALASYALTVTTTPVLVYEPSATGSAKANLIIKVTSGTAVLGGGDGTNFTDLADAPGSGGVDPLFTLGSGDNFGIEVVAGDKVYLAGQGGNADVEILVTQF